ncbi:hypothetical protein [Acanthamoeba castellanii mimivirus]|uniref:Uncharacterized protein R604 n=5 Tax=Mimivirus TaxID=315393 RepID=YR604_MIMIV|nr:hypothetical protein MIMI_gp0648 [Acanthamoeba polyphaga mimivirus]Q5UP72.1 RecName: Full=Uncharacterized protein R604 [Acanthamoeba polyphaga mimivirus]AHJ40242.2 hypothetical protein [Samba virus]ALR84192.1 hypothetical protein [Niemeyer virus]AMZ03047.1 hypothetical protein [Mimivirus Bombay]BAV61719.1 hypothetical protein [Acanthamoeba castellanii mimivirus]AAV50867.1 unknown [Acanthamoeba polyphaga mimivirus]
MSSLPRNAVARNSKMHKKRDSGVKLSRNINTLDAVCKKHAVGNLIFRNCKMASYEGRVSFVDHEETRGNMRSGVIVVKATSIYSSEDIYDVVKVREDKIARDLKKRQEDYEKTKLEVERLKRSEELANKLANNDPKHDQLVEKLNENNTVEPNNESTEESVEQITEQTVEQTTEQTVEESVEQTTEKTTQQTAEESVEQSTEQTVEKSGDQSTEKTTQQTAEESVEQSTEQPIEESNKNTNQNNDNKKKKKEKNKYYRNFMKDIKSKFSLKLRPENNYFEVKAETTDMIIEHSVVYEIVMVPPTKETYLLVIGDLQMKSSYLRQIDPQYKMDAVLKEQTEFMERIKAKEQLKIHQSPNNKLEPEDMILDDGTSTLTEIEYLGLEEES